MTTIQIDEEVFAHLQSHAVPLVDTPNATIRRLLGMSGQPAPTHVVDQTPPAKRVLHVRDASKARRVGPKQASASLATLVGAGMLKQGETLRLVNYRGEPVPDSEVMIRDNGLIWKGQSYSMSRLAQILLTDQGYVSTDVRGPRHWVTAAGTSILALWEDYLEDESDRRALRARADEPSVPFEDIMRDLSERGLI